MRFLIDRLISNGWPSDRTSKINLSESVAVIFTNLLRQMTKNSVSWTAKDCDSSPPKVMAAIKVPSSSPIPPRHLATSRSPLCDEISSRDSDSIDLIEHRRFDLFFINTGNFSLRVVLQNFEHDLWDHDHAVYSFDCCFYLIKFDWKARDSSKSFFKFIRIISINSIV